MKAIFITYDQAHHEAVIDILTRMSCRGYTSFGETQGRGSKTGDPHLGSHAWPSIASATISIVEDDRADSVLRRLKELDESKPLLGLRAFVWNVENSI
ncbi:MAG: hypothetical protein K2M93_02200 [Muribaculaceae bacterium]|nr:hypothetical protein [Muribaculaceae bacterium]